MSGMVETTRRGFTLIELIVIIGIIALLVSITMMVGANIMEKGRANKTVAAIQVLDSSLAEYIAENNNIPPTTVLEPSLGSNNTDLRLIPVADAVFDTKNPSDVSGEYQPRLINSVGLYLLQLADSPNAQKQIQNLNDEFVQLRPTYSPTSDSAVSDDKAIIGANADHPGIPTVLDGWGRPIRYVHPRYDGQVGAMADARKEGNVGNGYKVTSILLSNTEDELAVLKLRRNKIVKKEYADIGLSQRDGDGGNCPNDRPYFYSVGPDGDPSTIEDNVYTTDPVFTTPNFDNDP